MKKIPEGSFATISSFGWMLAAHRNARKGKRYRGDVLRFSAELEKNLLSLQEELRSGTYKTGEYRRIWVSVPKRRLVMALPYRDRIVQWCIYLLLNPYFDKRFIEDSYACRVGKGSHKAVERLQYWLRQINRRPETGWYYLKLDISKYFYRIDHKVLLEILQRHIEDRQLMELLRGIICNPKEPFGLPAGKKPDEVKKDEWLYDVGIPIGNLSSQLCANIVLNELDQYAKHKMHIHYYIRYMDDVLVLGPDKSTLKRWKAEIETFLHDRLKLELNRKTTIRPISMGMEFVGYRVWATHIEMRKSTTRRIKREVRAISRKTANGEMGREDFARRKASIEGLLKHANTASLRWRLNEIYTREMAKTKEKHDVESDDHW